MEHERDHKTQAAAALLRCKRLRIKDGVEWRELGEGKGHARPFFE